MAQVWKTRLARLSRMSWDEVRVRSLQALHKRRDLLTYWLSGSNGARQIEFVDQGKPGRFFFGNEGGLERAKLVQEYLPLEADAILREADEICAHRFRLLGYENLDYGKDVDWHLDAVHGTRAPMEVWFKIPFLDFAVLGDHKVIWELNRHQHLTTLAKASLLSGTNKNGDDKYVSELAAQWRSWVKANPYPVGINWGSTLEVAFRSLSWIFVDQLLAGSESGEFAHLREEILPALAFHGICIERFLSTYFSPNTHLLGEALALFFLGTLYPEMPGSGRWKESGWSIVLSETKRQVRPDGVYFEQSLHYHVYALDFLLYSRLLASQNNITIPAQFDAVIEKMLNVVAALAQAGPAEGFGDDDGGRLWNARRNRTEHMTDPLALGAVIYDREFPAAQLTEEAILLFGKRAVEKFGGSNSTNSVAFSDGGIYVLADSQPFPQTMMVDAGPQGEGRSGHGHADALSVRLTMNGQRWLVDSGTGVYIANDPSERNRYRGTGAHNTLLVDEADQAIPAEPFSWTQIPESQADRWIAGKTFTYFSGSHNGYARLADPVTHRRQILKLAAGPYLIRDIAEGRGEHDLELPWHFAPGVEVLPDEANGKSISLHSRRQASDSGTELRMMIPQDSDWQLSTHRTTISPAYGKFEQAPLVRCSARTKLPAEIATVLIVCATKENSAPPMLHSKDRFTGDAHGAVHCYELDYDGESHRFFFAGGQEWRCGSWSSDAQLLYYCSHGQRITHLIVVAGKTVRLDQRVLMTAKSDGAFFEWKRGDDHAAEIGEPENRYTVTPLFEELLLQRLPQEILPETAVPQSSEKQ